MNEKLVEKLKEVKKLHTEADTLKFSDLPEDMRREIEMDEAWSAYGTDRRRSAVGSRCNYLRVQAMKLINEVIHTLTTGEENIVILSSNGVPLEMGQIVEHLHTPGIWWRITEIPDAEAISVICIDSSNFGATDEWRAAETFVQWNNKEKK